MKRFICAAAALFILISVIPVFPVAADGNTDIKKNSPAIPADAGVEVDLSDYTFGGKTVSVWKDENGNTIDKYTPAEKGVFSLTAEVDGTETTVYVVAKNPDESEHVLFETDFSKYTSRDDLKADGYTLDYDATYTFEDGTLTIGNSPNNIMHLVLPRWLGDFGNYSITTEAKLLAGGNAEYWLGVAYRIQTRGANSFGTFYQMSIHENYNPINDIQFQERTSDHLWNYARVSGSGIIEPKDVYNTYSVAAYDKTVRYTMNGNEVLFASDSFFGREVRYYDRGLVGIAMSDIGAVSIKYIRVALQIEAPVQDETTLKLLNNSHDEMNLLNPIANVQYVSGKDAATALDGENAPGSILVTLSELDSVADFIKKCTEKSVIPTFRVDTAEEADSLIAALAETEFTDANAVSADAAILAKLRLAGRTVRTGLIVDLTASTLDSEAANEIRAKVRSAPATFCVVKCANASKQAVSELQQLSVAVWVQVDSDPADESFTADALRAVTSGANGIITKDHAALATAVNTNLAESAMTRLPTLVGHRGNLTQAPENTISGFLKAYENGAQAFELDIVITKDNEVVVLHDGSLERTTEFEDDDIGVGDMTLAEVKQYHVLGVDGEVTDETVPTLREVCEVFKDKDCRLLIEFKNENVEIIDAVADIIKEYGMEDRVNIISFSTKVLNAAIESFKGISSGYLFNTSSAETVEDILHKLWLPMICNQSFNSSMCPSSDILNTTFTQATSDRGMPVWSWTFVESDNDEGFFSGTDGMTTDDMQWVTNMTRVIEASASELKLGAGDSAEISVSSVTYGGETAVIPGGELTVKVIDGEDVITYADGKVTALADGTAHILYGYTTTTTDGTEYTLYTQPVTVTVGNDFPILWIAVGGGIAIVAIAVIVIVVVKGKKK